MSTKSAWGSGLGRESLPLAASEGQSAPVNAECRGAGGWRRHESPARYCSGGWSILPSVVWTEGWGTSVPFSAPAPSVLRVNPQVSLTVERLQILGHRNTTQCPTLPAPKPRGRREGLGTPCYNCAMNYCGGIICRCAEVSRKSAGTARATRRDPLWRRPDEFSEA